MSVQVESQSLSAADLLSRQEKKFTMVMPADVHRKLKRAAANHSVTSRELILEALENYVFPKYLKEVK